LCSNEPRPDLAAVGVNTGGLLIRTLDTWQAIINFLEDTGSVSVLSSCPFGLTRLLLGGTTRVALGFAELASLVGGRHGKLLLAGIVVVVAPIADSL
jgi:hypothetical protein